METITHSYAKCQAAAGGKIHVSHTWSEGSESNTTVLCGVEMAQSRMSFRAIRRGYLTTTTEPVTCAKCLRILERFPEFIVK
jgi:hypothetical protein